MALLIKQPETEEEFKNYYHLRWQILRAPWNQAEGTEIDEQESQCFHLMACDENARTIAVARLQFNSTNEAQIRYMAVKPSHEGHGIGRQLIIDIEKHAKENNCKQIVLDAREPAVGFYKKLGYQIVEKTYLLFNEIQHYRMIKNLPSK